jgi:hypothetical protein
MCSALLIGAAAVLLSCREPGPAAPDFKGPPLQASGVGSVSGLVACKPLAYDSVTRRVGPPGAVLRVSKHVLSIPGGALTQWVSITAVAPSDTVNRIQMQPEGLAFNKSVSLTMSYANCNLGASSQPKQIAYTSDSLVIFEYLPSTDDVTGRKVTGQLTHFSEYAVSW